MSDEVVDCLACVDETFAEVAFVVEDRPQVSSSRRRPDLVTSGARARKQEQLK